MLINAPLVNQLSEPVSDHLPDENKSANCVDASLSSGIRVLRPDLTASQVNGDELKDAVYGQGYTGATDPVRFIAYLKANYGVDMTEYTNTAGMSLVNAIKSGVHAGMPVTGAIPSLWGNSFTGRDMVHYSASTHEVLWCDDDGINLTAMNPWGGFYQKQPYNWWAERIVYGRVFTMEVAVGVPNGWHDDGTTLTAPNGVTVRTGFRDWVRSHVWDASDVPQAVEYATDHIEVGPGRDQGAGTAQDFVYTRLGWSPARGVFRCWVAADYHALRFDPTHCAGYVAPAPGPVSPPAVLVDGQPVNLPFTIPAHTVTIGE